jgi:flagellar biosynthesis anti-sigma factor FlgM
MIINNNVQAIAGAYHVSTVSRPQNSYDKDSEPIRDEVALSSDGVTFSQMMQELQGMDDVRAEKVDSVAEQIASGSYAPDSSDVAKKMLDLLF